VIHRLCAEVKLDRGHAADVGRRLLCREVLAETHPVFGGVEFDLESHALGPHELEVMLQGVVKRSTGRRCPTHIVARS
jgi:hypothetical protein